MTVATSSVPAVSTLIPSGSLTPAQRSQITSATWAEALIAQLNEDGVPVPYTTNNITNIQRWMTAEGGSGGGWLANNDPLNNTLNESGPFTYPDVLTGVQETAENLQDPSYGYPAIIEALQSNASPSQFSDAVVSSSWDGNAHYGVAAAGATGGDVVAGRGTDYLAGLGPLDAWATGTGSNPTGVMGQIDNAVGNAAVGAANAVPGVSAIKTVAGGELSVLQDVTSSTWWKRVGLGAAGVALFVVGLVIFTSQTKTGAKVVSEGEALGTDAAVGALAA